MANLLSELERFEQEMKDLGSEPSSSPLPPPHLVARVPLPPAPPPPTTGLPSSSSTAPTLLSSRNGTATTSLGSLTRLAPTRNLSTSVRPLPPRPSPVLATSSGTLPLPSQVKPVSSVATPTSWMSSGTASTGSSPLPSPHVISASQYTYSQPPTSLTSPSKAPAASTQPPVSATSSYFPVPFHLQQQPQSYPQTQQYQSQSYQQGPVQYSAPAQTQSQQQATQPSVVQAAAQPNYQYQAGYQPAVSSAAATQATPAPEIFAMPQQQQAQQLFQRDAQTITPEALESVKAALASGEGEHKSDARKRAVPRKAAGLSWEDATLADWPENDHRLFCGDLGNEVNDEVLTKAFTRFATFNMARVVRDKRTGKTKGYGFVSFANPSDLALAFKEMNGKYVGNRPIKLRKSTWKERTDQEAFEKHKNSKRSKSRKSLLHK